MPAKAPIKELLAVSVGETLEALKGSFIRETVINIVQLIMVAAIVKKSKTINCIFLLSAEELKIWQ